MRNPKRKADRYETGRRIAFLRGARGLSQEGLAQELIKLGASGSISKGTVSKWESGETDPTKMENVTTFFLLKVLAVTHEFLLFGPDVGPEGGGEQAAAKPNR